MAEFYQNDNQIDSQKAAIRKFKIHFKMTHFQDIKIQNRSVFTILFNLRLCVKLDTRIKVWRKNLVQIDKAYRLYKIWFN